MINKVFFGLFFAFALSLAVLQSGCNKENKETVLDDEITRDTITPF